MDKLQGTKSEEKQNEFDMTKVVEALAGIVARERKILCAFMWANQWSGEGSGLGLGAFEKQLANSERFVDGEALIPSDPIARSWWGDRNSNE